MSSDVLLDFLAKYFSFRGKRIKRIPLFKKRVLINVLLVCFLVQIMCGNKFEEKQEKQTMEQAGLQWRQVPEDLIKYWLDLEII